MYKTLLECLVILIMLDFVFRHKCIGSCCKKFWIAENLQVTLDIVNIQWNKLMHHTWMTLTPSLNWFISLKWSAPIFLSLFSHAEYVSEYSLFSLKIPTNHKTLTHKYYSLLRILCLIQMLKNCHYWSNFSAINVGCQRPMC